MMIANKEIEKLENSSVKLTVTIKKDNLREEYDNLVKKYVKTAHIKGFRKGKAPSAIIEQKFGDGIRLETSMSLIEESLKTIFAEIDEKPLPYAQPELQEGEEMKLDSDFTFQVVYDVYPEIAIGKYKGLTIEEPQVTISDDDINRELEKYREHNATVMEKAAGIVAKDDIVTVDYWETGDDGTPDEESRREDFVFTVGSGYNIYKIDDEVIGMKNGEEKIITKDFPEDYEYSEIAGKKKKIGIKIKQIKEKKLPELDDELAQDISDDYNTLDDLKKAIKEQLKESLDNQLRQIKTDNLVEQIVESSSFDIPKSMLNAELDHAWQNFVAQSRMPEEQLLKILEIQGKTKENFYPEWTPQAEKSIRAQLVIGKIMDEEKIEISEEEVDVEIARQAEKNNMDAAEAKDYYTKNRLLEYVKSGLQEKKLFDMLFESSTIKKGKKTSFVDLQKKKG